jgi:hypothetical protein
MLQIPVSIVRSKRRRQIRAKLDEVSRVTGTFFRPGATDCALITADGEVITGKSGTSKPLVPSVAKVRSLRANADAIAAALSLPPPATVHIRGSLWMAAAYALGPHTLVSYSPVSIDTKDDLLKEMDRALAAADTSGGAVAELAALVQYL